MVLLLYMQRTAAVRSTLLFVCIRDEKKKKKTNSSKTMGRGKIWCKFMTLKCFECKCKIVRCHVEKQTRRLSNPVL